MSRTSVICDTATGAIAGFVALSAGQIERAHLPKSAQRNRPDPVPVLLMGQLAVDGQYQGRGCARSLMLFALTTAVRFSEEIGCFGVLTHPLDDEVRAFYNRVGFETLPFDPRRGMVVRIVDLKRSGFRSIALPRRLKDERSERPLRLEILEYVDHSSSSSSPSLRR